MNDNSSSSPVRSEATRRRHEAQDAIHAAVQLLRQRHQVQEVSAYTMLVQASVDRRLSVRATADRMVEEAQEIPSPRS